MNSLEEPPKEWTEPTPNKYIDAGDLYWWLQNPKAMDQFAIQDEKREGVKLQVYWNAKGQDPYIVNENADRTVCCLLLIFYRLSF